MSSNLCALLPLSYKCANPVGCCGFKLFHTPYPINSMLSTRQEPRDELLCEPTTDGGDFGGRMGDLPRSCREDVGEGMRDARGLMGPPNSSGLPAGNSPQSME